MHAKSVARTGSMTHEADTRAVVEILPQISDDCLLGLVSVRLGRVSAQELRRLPARRRAGHAASRLALQRALRMAGAGGRSAPAWQSLAHSGRAGLAVVAPVPVGADIEPEGRFAETFAARVASDSEIFRVREAGVARECVPAALWTAKEAALKATGRGLRVHPRNARVVDRIEGGWRLHVSDGRYGDSDWDVATFGWPGWRIAIARPAGVGTAGLTVLGPRNAEVRGPHGARHIGPSDEATTC